MEVTSPSDIGPDDPPAPSKYFKKFPEKNVPGPDQESCQKIFNVYKTHTHTPMNIKFTRETMFTK